jgi:hypothetical protein
MMMFWHITKLFLADLLALAVVAGVLLAGVALWQAVWP